MTKKEMKDIRFLGLKRDLGLLTKQECREYEAIMKNKNITKESELIYTQTKNNQKMLIGW